MVTAGQARCCCHALEARLDQLPNSHHSSCTFDAPSALHAYRCHIKTIPPRFAHIVVFKSNHPPCYHSLI